MKWLINVPDELENLFRTLIEDGEVSDRSEITREQALSEAQYLLSCYNEGGHSLNEELQSDNPEVQKQAKSELRKLKQYLRNISKEA